MGENDNEGNTVAPPTPMPIVVPEEIVEVEAPVEMVPKQEAPMAHEVILVDVEPEPP
jgi:hypothetical protein